MKIYCSVGYHRGLGAALLVEQSRDRSCHWEFFPKFLPTKPCALKSTQPLKMSTGVSPEVKAAGAFG